MTAILEGRRYETAKRLLNISAVELFNPKGQARYYIYASGGKGPIYCDIRLALGDITVRRYIRDQFLKLLEEQGIEFDIIEGIATAGIPHASFLADHLEVPLGYVRGKAKDHGKGNQVEGPSVKDKSVILIEDLINTGGSSIEAVEAIRTQGGSVQCCLAIVTYNREDARQNFSAAQCPLFVLTDIEAILEVAITERYITEEQRAEVLEWRNDPKGWASRRGY